MTSVSKIGTLADTNFKFLETDIKNIRVYSLNSDDYKNPLFSGIDIYKYLKGSTENKKWFLKKFNKPKELVKLHVNNIECNFLTKYGLIKAASLCPDSKIGIIFREFIYALFDELEHNQTLLIKTTNITTNAMNTDEIKQEIANLEKLKKGIVYFIRDSGTNYIKIGRTDGDPEDRLSCLQVGNPSELIIVKLIECDDSIALERELHKKYAEFHIRGEWFNIGDV